MNALRRRSLIKCSICTSSFIQDQKKFPNKRKQKDGGNQEKPQTNRKTKRINKELEDIEGGRNHSKRRFNGGEKLLQWGVCVRERERIAELPFDLCVCVREKSVLRWSGGGEKVQ